MSSQNLGQLTDDRLQNQHAQAENSESPVEQQQESGSENFGQHTDDRPQDVRYVHQRVREDIEHIRDRLQDVRNAHQRVREDFQQLRERRQDQRRRARLLEHGRRHRQEPQPKFHDPNNPDMRNQLWESLKFKQTNTFWNKCSPCYNYNGECCCCLETNVKKKRTPCRHIICYDCCVSLFNSTISQEEQGISETKCPVCRQVLEPVLKCQWCKNKSGVDSDFLYCQFRDELLHQDCFRYAFPNGYSRRFLRISQ